MTADNPLGANRGNGRTSSFGGQLDLLARQHFQQRGGSGAQQPASGGLSSGFAPVRARRTSALGGMRTFPAYTVEAPSSSGTLVSYASVKRMLSAKGYFQADDQTTGLAARDAEAGVWGNQPTAPRSPARIAAPVKTALAIFDRWKIDDQVGASILGERSPEFVALLRVGRTVLRSRDAQDRAALFIRLYEGIYSLFSNSETERQWIRKAQPHLEGGSILDLLTEGSFLNLARAQAFVDFLNGR